MKLGPRKRSRPQLERRNETQAAIMSAALRILSDDGYAGFSASRVAARAGVSRGAQEHYFPKGLMVQVDDPFLPDIFVEPALDDTQKKRRAEVYVEATNAALAGIPAEMVRFHTCYGINEGPRLYEASLADVIKYVLRIKAGSYSFEAANPRHEHEYHLFERIKVPEGKVLCPGMITHDSNIVEHPELIAERIIRFAKLVGRENVIAAADCGFSSQALYKTEVHNTVVWEKFKALRQGADIASRQLWG
ncbi:MAG: TetR family transcriptional regulator [Xanthobacteraceae bacterium]